MKEREERRKDPWVQREGGDQSHRLSFAPEDRKMEKKQGFFAG